MILINRYTMTHFYDINKFDIDTVKWDKKSVYIDVTDNLSLIHWIGVI